MTVCHGNSTHYAPGKVAQALKARTMASKETDEANQEQEKRSGKSTPEYKNVLDSMEALERAIKADGHAKDSLCTKFKMESWIDVNVKNEDIDGSNLITKVLITIEQSASEHETFWKMLNDTTGLQNILPTLKGRIF